MAESDYQKMKSALVRDMAIVKASLKTRKKAQHNIIKWGVQDRNTIIKAMMEELGEIARADLDEEGDNRLVQECRDLGALCLQMEVFISANTKD